MNQEAAGIYFDGKSAAPQAVTIVLNTLNGVLQFQTETATVERWLLGELSFENVGTTLQLQKQQPDGIAILKITDAYICSCYFKIS